jgi:hypothetical protein
MSQSALLPDPNDGKGARSNATATRPGATDRVIHDWYRFVLSFPPHLVREYLDRFRLTPGQAVLDPFCGTGTTVVEAKLHGIGGIGVEANALAHFASSVKTDWTVDPGELLEYAQEIAKNAAQEIAADPAGSLRTLEAEAESLLLQGFNQPAAVAQGACTAGDDRLIPRPAVSSVSASGASAYPGLLSTTMTIAGLPTIPRFRRWPPKSSSAGSILAKPPALRRCTRG